ncbi:glycosyltransferase [Candidatus Wolfebacteria bacterium]|nr:glycosyltransferase [Candidatus Wolfebacteria bacterium]
MKILLVGENFRGAALESIYNNLLRLGIETEIVSTNVFFKTSLANRILNKFLKIPRYFGIGIFKINKIVLDKASSGKFDFILFMKPIFIYPKTIAKIKKYSKIIGLTMDYAGILKTNSYYFYKSMPLFDLYLPSDPNNIKLMHEYGVKKVYALPLVADPICHYPVKVSVEDKGKLGTDIVFLGTYVKNEKRVDFMEHLCQDGYDVKIYGNSWDKLPYNSCLRKNNRIILGNTPCEEMAKIIGASKIILAFMRDQIKEPIACRTFEILLCGGFMLHQRTKEAEEFFTLNETVFFETYEEMKNKIDFYLKHSDLRAKIAKAGRERVLNCGRLNGDQVKKMINILKNEFNK